MIRFFAIACTLLSTPAAAQPDPYAPAKAIIADIHKIVTPNGIEENLEVTLGGARQAISIRGADKANPILIFVHGGPGAVEMPFAWAFQRPWEDYFTVVQWDQRGAGKSYALNDPQAIAPTMTLDRYRDDAIELIDLLRRRFGQRKVVLMGHSWGSAVGLAVAVRRPDLLHAYVGVGQAIDFRENERAGIAWTLEHARKEGNAQAIAAIAALKPYPDSGPFTIEKADGWRKYGMRYGSLLAYRPDTSVYFHTPRLSPDYTPEDRANWSKGSAFSVTTLWPRLAEVSFTPVRRIKAPVIMLLGRHDYTVPSPIAAAWMEKLQAPKKRTIWFEHSGHMPMVEEPGRVFAALLEHVLPLTKER